MALLFLICISSMAKSNYVRILALLALGWCKSSLGVKSSRVGNRNGLHFWRLRRSHVHLLRVCAHCWALCCKLEVSSERVSSACGPSMSLCLGSFLWSVTAFWCRMEIILRSKISIWGVQTSFPFSLIALELHLFLSSLIQLLISMLYLLLSLFPCEKLP